MSGDLYLKEDAGGVVTVTSTGASTTTGTATSAGTVDLRAAGTTGLIEDLMAVAELTVQWTTTTAIAAGTIVADLYFVPRIDGTNDANIDTTSGSSYIASNYRVGSFIAPNQPSTSTAIRFATAPFDLFPAKYNVYLINRSGQTFNANWTLKIAAARAQYS